VPNRDHRCRSRRTHSCAHDPVPDGEHAPRRCIAARRVPRHVSFSHLLRATPMAIGPLRDEVAISKELDRVLCPLTARLIRHLSGGSIGSSYPKYWALHLRPLPLRCVLWCATSGATNGLLLRVAKRSRQIRRYFLQQSEDLTSAAAACEVRINKVGGDTLSDASWGTFDFGLLESWTGLETSAPIDGCRAPSRDGAWPYLARGHEPSPCCRGLHGSGNCTQAPLERVRSSLLHSNRNGPSRCG
jgi:hypothetical protein